MESPPQNKVKVGIAKVPLDKIDPCPFQVRFSLDVDAEFAGSIKNLGIIHPPCIRQKKADTGRFELITGSLRKEAARKLGIKEIECDIGNWNDQQALAMIAQENLHRKDLKQTELARWITKFVMPILREKLGSEPTHQEIAELIGKDRSYVSKLILLVENPEVFGHLDKGNITSEDAYHACTIRDEKERKQFISEAIQLHKDARKPLSLRAKKSKTNPSKCYVCTQEFSEGISSLRSHPLCTTCDFYQRILLVDNRDEVLAWAKEKGWLDLAEKATNSTEQL